MLAKVVAAVGVLVVLLLLGFAVLAGVSGSGIVFVVLGVVGMLVAGAFTVLGWAGVTLATVIAGHIAEQ